MNLDILDNEELMRLSIAAMEDGRDADAIVMLKHAISRDPANGAAAYLLAAQYAQIGMMDRAEQGFRAVLELEPSLRIARFQLGQLLAVNGDAQGAREVLSPMFDDGDALAAYARGISLIADGMTGEGLDHLAAGSRMPQPIQALAADMDRLQNQLKTPENAVIGVGPAAPAPAFLAGYGYGSARSDE
jgi:cytochrome c-type biogenesis protein CcmH/NrfG